ncbi:MAG: transglycosylase SLT domain-containing protein [Pseudomonadota bacterium]
MRSVARRLAIAPLALLAAAQPAAFAVPPPATIRYDTSPRFGDFDEIAKRRQLRVLVPYSRTLFFVDETGTHRGLSYEFMRAFEEHLNRKHAKNRHSRLQLIFIPVARDQLRAWLEDGRGDVAAANLTITPRRHARVDFTRPLAGGVHEVFITSPDAPPIDGIDGLAGREVHVRPASAYREHLDGLNQSLISRGLAPMVLRDAPGVFETEDMLEMANAGLYDIVVADEYLADLWSKVFTSLTVRRDLVLRSDIEVAFAICKNSPMLKAELDAFIAGNAVGSALGNTLVKRYLASPRFARNAAADEEMRKFRGLVRYFRKYGEQYSIDWLLMAAQGYQESALDQAARSQVGAIGVMQLMPATGKDMALDITVAESNIHAGVKYMRWLVDNYFDDPKVGELDRMLFAFAAYNAGPGRLRGLRRTAEQRGLDPNVWFHHVEHVAAEKIGRETVQYVANIFKYYIAYQRIEEQRAERRRAREATRASSAGS